MNKKDTSNSKNTRNLNFKAEKMNSSDNLKKKKDKSLPWWVELLFVQIGLPDKFLIKILKSKKKYNEFLKTEKKSIIIFFFIISTLAYFYPVVKHSKNKLDCELEAKSYILEKINTIKFSKRKLKMLSVNFCYGGKEIYEIEN